VVWRRRWLPIMIVVMVIMMLGNRLFDRLDNRGPASATSQQSRASKKNSYQVFRSSHL